MREIATLGWQDGSALGTESQLIARYCVSRATLREAVRELERLGAVRMRRGIGLVVASPARETVVSALAGIIDLSGTPVGEVAYVHDLLMAHLRKHAVADSPVVELLLDTVKSSHAMPLRGDAARQQSAVSKRKLGLSTAYLIARDIAGIAVTERLGTEAGFLLTYAVSRATLREALAILEGQGLVIRRRGIGGGLFRGAPDARSTAEMAATYLRYLQLSGEALADARDAIEPEVAALAARDATPDQIAAMRQSLDHCVTRPDDLEQGRQFHIAVADASGKPVLSLFVQVLLSVFYYMGPEVEASFLRRLHETHAALLDTIAAHDPDAARRAMRAHLDFARGCMSMGMLAI